MPPAHFVGRARRTLLRYLELVPFWGHLLRQGVGQMVRPPFAHWPPTKNRLPPAQDVGCASGTLLREFGNFIKKRLRPAADAGRGPETLLRLSYPPSRVLGKLLWVIFGAFKFE